MTTENLFTTAPGERAGWEAESEVRLADGERLCVREWPVSGRARAEVILTHGLGEHGGRYGHVAVALARRGIRVKAYDLRGHGRSSGRRCDVEGYDCFLHDLAAVCALPRREEVPVFLFGHSMGGQVTLRFLQEHQPSIAGAIVASPWLRLAFDPPRWKLAVARAVLRIAPGLRFSTGMRLDRLTRDAAHVQAMPDAHLMSHRISARMYFAVVEEGARALAEGGRIGVPLLLLHGDADPVTHWQSTEALASAPGPAEKTVRIYPGALHEAHNDVCREAVLRDIGDWIEARVAGGNADLR